MRPTSPHHDRRGFTLVELMVGLTVLTVLLLVLYGTFFRAQKAASRATDVANTRIGARLALQLIEREVRMSGSGWGTIPVGVSLGGTPATYRAVMAGYGGTGSTSDTITIMGSWGAHSTLRASMPTTSSTIQVLSAAEFSDSDFVVVTNGSSAFMFRATSVDKANNNIIHDSTSPWNNTLGFSGFGSGFTTGADVYQVRLVSYYVRPPAFRKTSLMRQQDFKAPAVVAYGVSDMQVNYALQTGTTTRNMTDLSLVNEVIPTIHTLSGTPARLDSTWAAIHPRTF